ncbi:aldo/keto reductase [bacterium]|nr:aldo/keto reductase [bacterium]
MDGDRMDTCDSSQAFAAMGRRQALEMIGTGLLGLAALSTAGCTSATDAPQTNTAAPSAGSASVTAPQAAPKSETGQLTYRTDPRSGNKISMLGFGCMRFPTLPDPNNPEQKIIDEENAYKLIDYAWSHGINYFDTAHPYHGGTSEIMVGKALSRYPRSSFFLADKMPTPKITSLDTAKEIFEGQLKKCQTDYFDYYLLHNLSDLEVTKRVYLEYGVLDYLQEQKRQGRIRQLGWSFHGNRELFTFALKELAKDWDFVQIQMNYHDWLYGDTARGKELIPAKWMYDQLAERSIPAVIMEPLLGGRLARLNQQATEILKAADPEASPAAWAFRFFASYPNIITVLSGMTYMEHLQENLRTFSPLKPLSSAEQQTLERALQAFRSTWSIPCTECGYCMPCPYGVNIPGVFNHYNKCVAQNRLPSNAQDPEYSKYRRQYLIDYSRSLNPLQQADRCIGCGKCLPACPQKIAIPAEMHKIFKFTEGLHSHHGAHAHSRPSQSQNRHGAAQ